MRVAFVLPAPTRVPSGGYAVVFRHAAGLAARGHRVRVVMPQRIGGETGRVRALARRLADGVQGVRSSVPYSAAGVETSEPPTLGADPLDDDAVIATGVQTVSSIARRCPGRGWWFVQGDETFVRPDAREAWSLGLPMIPCARWLAREITAHGGHVAGVVPNAVDTDHFGLDVPIRERGDVVLALYHRHEVKGPDTLLEVYRTLARSRPGARLVLFSARRPSHAVPTGVDVIVRPDRDALRRLYNQAAVFLHTSRSEGWALTPMEAAACGAAVVATASQGPREYLKPGASMTECEVGDADALAESVVLLLDAADVRVAQAERALVDVGRFTWAESTDRLDAILSGSHR